MAPFEIANGITPLGGDKKPGQVVVVERLGRQLPDGVGEELGMRVELPALYAGRPDGRPDSWEQVVWHFLNLTGESIWYRFSFVWKVDDGSENKHIPAPVNFLAAPTRQAPHADGSWVSVVANPVQSAFKQHMTEMLTMKGYRRARYRYAIEILDTADRRRGEIDPELVIEGRP